MIRSLAALSLLIAPLAAAPAQTGGAQVDRDALCFVASAVAARRMLEQGQPMEARSPAYIMTGAANFFAGRVSTRYSGAALNAVLNQAVEAVQRGDPQRLADGCLGDFTNFMGAVARLSD